MEFTDWHRLFGMTLTDFFTGTDWTVELEKDLSLKKQLLDVVIIEKREGNPLPEDQIPDGLENMSRHNLLSYKSFRESLDDWTADELAGHFVNYRKQVSPSLKKLLPREDFRLYAVCTRYPAKLAKEFPMKPVKKGVYDLPWGSRDIRIVVTGRIEKTERNAVWLMFSAVKDKVGYGVARYRGKMDEMSATINDLLARYHAEGVIAMPYTVEDYRKEIKERALKMMSLEERLKGLSPEEIFSRFSPEEIFKRFSAEEIFKRFSPEERLKGLSAEEIEACLKKMRKPKRKRKA